MGLVDWKRRTPARKAMQSAATNRHTVTVGKSGSGKSYGKRHDVRRNLEERRFQLILDPNEAFGTDCLGDNLSRFEDRIEVLHLDVPSPTWGVELFHWSDAEDEAKRLQENLNEFDRFYTSLADERDLNVQQAPMHNFNKGIAQNIFARRTEPIDLQLLPYLFIPSPQQTFLLSTCTYEKAVLQVLKTNEIKNEFQRQTIVGPFQRLVDPFFENLDIQALLSTPPAPWGEWMIEGKTVIVQASMDTPVSVRRTVMGMLRRKTHRTAFAYHAEHGVPIGNGYQIIIDEAARLKNGVSEADTNQQSRKTGGSEDMIFQILPITPEFREILANVTRLEVYQQATYQACLSTAEEVLAFLHDSDKVKHTEYRERTINRGVQRETIHTTAKQHDKHGKETGHTNSEHILSTPNIESVTDEVKTYATHDDQLREWVKKIRELKVGERIVIDGTSVNPNPEKVLPLESPWKPPLKQLRIDQALARIRSRSHYKVPDFRPPQVPSRPDLPDPVPTSASAAPSAADRFRGSSGESTS